MKQKKILIIDDEFAMRYLIEHQLKQNGYDVNLANNGPDGLKAAHLHKPDLIVLDVMMPGMNGFEVCRLIRDDPEIAEIPVIFLTASEVKEYKTQAFDVGADDYLTKPFQADELMAHITAVLQRGERIQTDMMDVSRGRVVSMFSPKGGVGTTTLAVQLAETMTIHENQPVVMIDLDLPFGGIGPMLHLDTASNIVDLLTLPVAKLTLAAVMNHAQRHRAELLVITAPGKIFAPDTKSLSSGLKPVLDLLVSSGYQVILDLGSKLNRLTRVAMYQSDLTFVITSGQPVANKLHDQFVATAEKLGLEPQRLMPVINELHGSVEEVNLARVPVARIPHAGERSRKRLWLHEQGMQKLLSVMR